MGFVATFMLFLVSSSDRLIWPKLQQVKPDADFWDTVYVISNLVNYSCGFCFTIVVFCIKRLIKHSVGVFHKLMTTQVAGNSAWNVITVVCVVYCLMKSIIDFSLGCLYDVPPGSIEWRSSHWPSLAAAAIDLSISIGS